jgi:hypothetical protein
VARLSAKIPPGFEPLSLGRIHLSVLRHGFPTLFHSLVGALPAKVLLREIHARSTPGHQPDFFPLQNFKEQSPFQPSFCPFSAFSPRSTWQGSQPSVSTLSCSNANASGDIQQTSKMFNAEAV